MKFRIALWASAGFLVAAFWAFYFAEAGTPNAVEPMVYTLAHLTCPIALLNHYPIGLFSVLLANAATYSLIGLIVETARRQLKHAN